MDFVNPELRPALRQASPFLSELTYNDASLPRLRQLMRTWDAPLDTPEVTQHLIPGAEGDPGVRVYVTGNAAGASKPTVLHVHGGGFVAFRAKDSLRAIQKIAITHDCVVVTVDYRLAPETRFPGSLEDIYATLRWIHQNAKSLGVDTRRIAVKGESAGAGHAAALAIAVRDRKEFSLCLQVLEYPMLDDRTGSTKRLPPQFGRYVWNSEANCYGWTSLLGVPAGSTRVPEKAVPARERNLGGLAPAFIGVGSIDLFAPEDIDYAQRMMMAGTSVELLVVPGAYHGFDVLAPDTSVSRQFTATWNEALRRAFTRERLE
ncbi:alpha/beta hydrolase [Acidobacteria bacterium AB60]|nr:alpha/beta hydrolase [Acidobacteria bacterium AB60]